ncbi:MAG: bifunctional 4-hydroxy-2-oxoglutarate aldolase/2-dehydro-3-deoxy-phosphogluconate aldolase [Haloferacaceae archaeon]|nr:bifunctional 4-hydroxy-2-oxoglutarate aldolase/2-dehydro-3-deoxy-phosphogluconate aldolase [Haloferacaceae archaeon]
MHTSAEFMRTVERTRIIAVIRGSTPAQIHDVVEALLAGGIELIEITANTPGVTEQLASVAASFGDAVTLGAGTVLDAETAGRVIDAGAGFLVTPTVTPAVIQTAHRFGVPVIPGGYTPTEVLAAAEAGATAVKVFPAGTGGPDHLAAIGGPLPQVPLIPTGGITPANAGAFIEAGAIGVGVGGGLVDLAAVDAGTPEQITATATALRTAVGLDGSA